MRQIIFLISIIVLFGVIQSPIASAQSLKIGYVNSVKILQELPEAQEAQKKLDALKSKIYDELKKISDEHDAKLEEYQKKLGMMNEQTKLASQQEIAALEQKNYQYRIEQDSLYQTQSSKLYAPINEKILKVIKIISNEEKLKFMFNDLEQPNVFSSVLLYVDPNSNYTFKVLDRLKRTN